MTEYTIIYFGYGTYSLNKESVRKIINDNGLVWNENKIKTDLPFEDILNVYKTFKIDDKIINDTNLIGRLGSVGIWNNSENAIKIIIFSKKDKDGSLPVLLIFKGDETSSFYKTFIKYCISLGCTISKVVEDDGKFKEVFRKRINIELISNLDNDEETKKVLIELFKLTIDHGYIKFSDSFLSKWKECINKYGNYRMSDLSLEIEKINESRKNKIGKIEIPVIKKCVDKEVVKNDNIIKHKFTIKKEL